MYSGLQRFNWLECLQKLLEVRAVSFDLIGDAQALLQAIVA